MGDASKVEIVVGIDHAMKFCFWCKLLSFPRLAVIAVPSVDTRNTPQGLLDVIRAKYALIITSFKLFSKASLGNACLFRLLMLYYRGSSLNDLWSPLGIETHVQRIQYHAALHV